MTPELAPLKMTEASELSKASYLMVVDQEKLIGLLTERDLVRFTAQGMNLGDLADYVESLVAHLFLSYGRGKYKIKPRIDIDNMSLNLDRAISCGLIINELVSNALKHGLPQNAPENNSGEISIEIHQKSDSDHFGLVIAGNGIGWRI